jgi:hypothetical protein
MRSAFPIAVTVVLGACSQRVTPEEEFAREERERPIVSAEAVQMAPAAPPDGMGARSLASSAEDAAQTIRGTIEAPADAAGDVLFLFVRAAGAVGGPPLAVQRIPSPSFPHEFVIGPQDAMIAGESFPERVTVEARLDGDGDAMTEEAGDLSARSETAPGATGVTLALAAEGA